MSSPWTVWIRRSAWGNDSRWQSQNPGSACRCHFENFPARTLGQHFLRRSQLAEKVQRLVAGEGVGSDTYGNARIEKFAHGHPLLPPKPARTPRTKHRAHGIFDKQINVIHNVIQMDTDKGLENAKIGQVS